MNLYKSPLSDASKYTIEYHIILCVCSSCHILCYPQIKGPAVLPCFCLSPGMAPVQARTMLYNSQQRGSLKSWTDVGPCQKVRTLFSEKSKQSLHTCISLYSSEDIERSEPQPLHASVCSSKPTTIFMLRHLLCNTVEIAIECIFLAIQSKDVGHLLAEKRLVQVCLTLLLQVNKCLLSHAVGSKFPQQLLPNARDSWRVLERHFPPITALSVEACSASCCACHQGRVGSCWQLISRREGCNSVRSSNSPEAHDETLKNALQQENL